MCKTKTNEIFNKCLTSTEDSKPYNSLFCDSIDYDCSFLVNNNYSMDDSLMVKQFLKITFGNDKINCDFGKRLGFLTKLKNATVNFFKDFIND